MANKRWSDLSPRGRRLILVGGVLEGSLKIVALADLRKRPADEVRGPKLAWAAAISLVNAMGAVPAAYLLFGRHTSGD